MTANNFLIFSAYTKDTNYENIIINLKNDCARLQIPFISLEYASTGSWVENTMLKPKNILDIWDTASKQFKYIIWIDADARVLSYPKYFSTLIEEDIDFSVFQMGSISRVTSGTIFIKLSDKMREFVEAWLKICQTSKERRGDQHSLRQLIASDIYQIKKIKYTSLPYSYCYVFDDTLRKLEPTIAPLTGEPVIRHEQASRDKRNLQKQTLYRG